MKPTLPLQEMKTIGDELSDKGISWAWYGGGWDNAVAGRASPIFNFTITPLPISGNTPRDRMDAATI